MPESHDASLNLLDLNVAGISGVPCFRIESDLARSLRTKCARTHAIFIGFRQTLTAGNFRIIRFVGKRASFVTKLDSMNLGDNENLAMARET